MMNYKLEEKSRSLSSLGDVLMWIPLDVSKRSNRPLRKKEVLNVCINHPFVSTCLQTVQIQLKHCK